jgi:diaminopimelate epimerase
MAEILNAHGSKNDIFLLPSAPSELAPEADLRAFVRNLCARTGPLGGDGVYFYDARPRVPRAWFFNPDGSPAEFCGNGMRCLGRVILDERGADAAVIRSGEREYTVRRAEPTAEGVARVRLEHPPVDFGRPVVADRAPLTAARLPELDPRLEFTAVAIPNPHLVALVDSYVESDLVTMGEQIAARPDLFPSGANLSLLLPVTSGEVFVRTYERGAGLTASCGSGMAAARAVYSRLRLADPDQPVLIRNVGGLAEVCLRVADASSGAPDPQWSPVLTGNATFVYRAEVDPAALIRGHADVTVEPYPAETKAYDALDHQNTLRLQSLSLTP